MKNITENMLQFKEASRHVWNTYLLKSAPPMALAMQESFEVIERELFRALVLLPHSIAEWASDYRVLPMPVMLRAKEGLVDVPVQQGTLDDIGNVRWTSPQNIPASEISKYHFFEFFDWNFYGHLDFFYIKASSSEGKVVLINQTYCDFMLNDKLKR